MKMTEVYIGTYQNNDESLFLKKNEQEYYDLKLKRRVDIQEVDVNSLVCYQNVIQCKVPFKRNIIRLYDLDRLQEIFLDRVFIGQLCQVKSVQREYYGTNILNAGIHERLHLRVIKKYALFQSQKFSVRTVTDLEDGTVYEKKLMNEVGDFFVDRDSDELQSFSDVLGIYQTKMQKGKILKKFRDYRDFSMKNTKGFIEVVK